MAKLANFAITCLLAGCASSPVVSVPVSIPCVPDPVPTMPEVLPNEQLSALDDRVLVLQIASERLELLSYAKQAEAIISGCR